MFCHRIFFWCCIFIRCCLLFYWSKIALQWWVSFCCTMKWISYMYTYIRYLLDLPPTHLGRHRAPSCTPCAVQHVPTSYLFYTWLCIYVKPNLPIRPTLPFLALCPFSIRSLCLCLYSYPTNRFICTIFLDSTYMR